MRKLFPVILYNRRDHAERQGSLYYDAEEELEETMDRICACSIYCVHGIFLWRDREYTAGQRTKGNFTGQYFRK